MAQSQPSLQPVPGSNYSPLTGSTFYLLSNSSYGSQEEAKVRLEANAREQYYLEQYGGADVRLYRINDPLAFLKGQKNLHRISVAGTYRGDGVANTLSYLWDSWYKGSRRSWQRLLNSESRTLATQQAPELSTSGNINLPTRYEAPTPYAPLKSLPLISQFRYPIWQAKGIEPPKGVKLEGSSSEFTAPRPGNVLIPLGKQTPGLYLVEAIIGDHRATTLLFVSDSVVVSKIAGHQLLAWSVDRQTGKPLANTQLLWSDGTGTLQSRQSDAQGIALFEHQSPEHSYLLARDAQGGLTISENFYYDSEIYNTKIYAFTDRPMYRPGDRVNMKFYGRNFTSARDSQAVADSELELEIIDPAGIPLLKQKSPWRATQGADLSFTLPADAQAGGYEAHFSHGEDHYSAAFRVAEYVKPHFDIQLVLDKPSHKTGETIKGQLQLRYPNGDPVKQAAVTLSLRAQKLSMVEGDLSYSALFPVKLQQQELKSDEAGNLAFELPAAKEPSRYVLTLLANDSAAWRVKSSREILIERGMTPYQLTSARQFSSPGESITFDWHAQANNSSAAIDSVPSQYQLLRLEDRTRESGTLAAGANSLDLSPSRSGSYTLSLLDAEGNLLAATNHWVSGEGMKAAPGAIEVRFDRRSYQAGDEAQALITFPSPVSEALLTLERDKVEQQGLLSQTGSWFKAKQLSPTQWQVAIPVSEAYAPNMTFSVLNAQQGEYLFRNAGLKVAQPQVALTLQSDKPSYQPGDKVELTIKSQVGESPVAAALSVSVVDEMVYLLQPELAPNIHDFFYHPRRNNVRTSSSINFIAYDMSLPYQAQGGNGRRFNERGVKMLERPRRDEKDTAAWFPNLQSDAQGNAKLSFIMPDSLTRWRITVRAMTADGVVGQAQSHLLSDKPFYVKWTGPTRFRHGDKPQVELVAFNHQAAAKAEEAKVTLEGAVAPQEQSLTLKPGANYLSLPLNELQGGEVTTRLQSNQGVLDSQVSQLDLLPLAWPGLRQQSLSVSGGSATLTLPPDASQLTLTLQPEGRSAFLRIMDELIAYPYGCLEQTASHLIPLSLAYGLLSEPEIKEQVRGELLNHRLRLVQMAGIDGSFGWWGNQSQGSLLLSSYAYYADWRTSRALGLNLPEGQGDALLGLYQQYATEAPVLHRMLALWWMDKMGLPIETLLQGADSELGKALEAAQSDSTSADTAVVTTAEVEQPVAEEAATAQEAAPTTKAVFSPEANPQTASDSLVMSAPNSPQGLSAALLLSSSLHLGHKSPQPEPLRSLLISQLPSLQQSQDPLLQSLLRQQGMGNPALSLEQLLAQITPQSPTLERALILTLLEAEAKPSMSSVSTLRPSGAWKAKTLASGQQIWRWRGKGLPTQLTIPGAEAQSLNAELSYQSGQDEQPTLPVTLERKLYRLEPLDDGKGFDAKPVAHDETILSNGLYVDEITLTPSESQPLRFGLLEVPLPPGASVEPSTWGVNISNLGGNAEPLSFARDEYSEGDLSYQVPIPELKEPKVVRQLLRFAERGEFNLPASRYFRMYQPGAKAMTDQGQPSHWRVE